MAVVVVAGVDVLAGVDVVTVVDAGAGVVVVSEVGVVVA